jgi:hypothetical protein
VAGGWRRLHNEELRNLYTSQNIIKVIVSQEFLCTQGSKEGNVYMKISFNTVRPVCYDATGSGGHFVAGALSPGVKWLKREADHTCIYCQGYECLEFNFQAPYKPLWCGGWAQG